MAIYEKDLRMSVLLDLYGSVLTDKQRDVIELYYNEDLSLAEIAEHEKISRQGVRDSIKHAEQTLLDMDSCMHLSEKFGQVSGELSEIRRLVDEIYAGERRYGYSADVAARLRKILECADRAGEILYE